MRRIALALCLCFAAFSFEGCAPKCEPQTLYIAKKCEAQEPTPPALQVILADDDNLTVYQKVQTNYGEQKAYAETLLERLKSCK